MKRIIYIAVFCLAGLAVSCDDFLTVASPDEVTSGSFWRNQSDAESGLAAAYSQLEFSVSSWQFAEVKWPVEAFREDIVRMGNDASTYSNWVELAYFSYTNGNSELEAYWNNNYKGISFANQVIEKVADISDENIDPATRTQIVNEAHFLRGYYHLKLLLNFREIPVHDKYITEQADMSKAVSSRPDAWEFIIGEFEAATALPAKHSSDHTGRATSGAAHAYLGLCHLTRAWEEPAQKEAHLTEAVKALDAVKGYDLEKDFLSMFDGTNKNCEESIFELQFSMNTANGAAYRTQLHLWIGASEVGGWDEILPSDILVAEFKKEGEIATTGRYDSRAYSTMFFQSDYFNDPVALRVFGKTYNERFVSEQNPVGRSVFRKLLPPTAAEMSSSYSAINIPLMRYANVLLMKAEALNELDRTSEAIPLINQVRDVHGDMPPMAGTSKAEVAAQIEHERMIEFPLENWRWYDLRRWGKLSEAMQAAGRTGFNMEKNAFYPITLTEVDTNGMID